MVTTNSSSQKTLDLQKLMFQEETVLIVLGNKNEVRIWMVQQKLLGNYQLELNPTINNTMFSKIKRKTADNYIHSYWISE